MKITEYSAITEFSAEHIMLVDGDTGTRKMLISDAIYAALHLGSPENHRLVFRGKNLGETVTEEQLATIKRGEFKDLWLGDYWNIDGVRWRIADFDYWYKTGNPATNDHHVVIVPDTHLYTGVMNPTATVTGAYMGSAMYKTGLTNAKAKVTAAFGADNILTHKEFLTNAVTENYASAGTWADSTVELMNEIMVYGSYIETPSGPTVKRYTIDKQQLALFAACPKFVNTGGAYWVRDVTSAKGFACVGYYGSATTADANTDYGVRPVFGIG